MDTRGENIGSFQTNVRRSYAASTWCDPLAMWHNDKSTIGYADGHGEMHTWQNKHFIEWCERAMYSPTGFSFGLTPPADELEDIQFVTEAWPCKTIQ